MKKQNFNKSGRINCNYIGMIQNDICHIIEGSSEIISQVKWVNLFYSSDDKKPGTVIFIEDVVQAENNSYKIKVRFTIISTKQDNRTIYAIANTIENLLLTSNLSAKYYDIEDMNFECLRFRLCDDLVNLAGDLYCSIGVKTK